ncbi:GNAT family N-acetyltransferase [Pseudomonas vlassakiae]|uniref:GNAT family N-acetyltransferase n=1 Tax=Pseudomonas vlassakiae TaxID=485888 RepID=UPI001CEC2BD0|nr:GNAT family N-acetyltransferase [Pseudomonas vlassakiae]
MIRCKRVYGAPDKQDGQRVLIAASDAWRTFARDLTRRAMLPYYREFDLLWIEQAFDEAWGWREQWLVVEGETVLGFCSLSQDRQALFIRELHLLPEQRGRGVGSWVLETLIDWAVQRRLPLLRLMVFKSNPARQLYLRHGFVEMGEDDCFVRMQRVIG